MNFDYTYISFGNAKIFEPVTILTNSFIGAFCIYSFVKIKKYKTKLSIEWAYFFLLLGISSCFGSTAHAVHYELGDLFLNTVIFLMNSFSLVSIYFCFKAANTTLLLNKPVQNKFTNYIVLAWVLALLIITLIKENLLLDKIVVKRVIKGLLFPEDSFLLNGNNSSNNILNNNNNNHDSSNNNVNDSNNNNDNKDNGNNKYRKLLSNG